MSFRDEYTILDELGQGGFAKVYKARHNNLGYIRAIRVLNSQIIHGEKDSTYLKFLEECKILLRLGNGNNPNIVHIYQPRLIDNTAIVEMDFVDGKDLYHHLEDNSSFIEPLEVIGLLKDIGGALAYCHEDIYRFCMDKDDDDLPDDPNNKIKPLVSDKDRQRLIKKYRVIHNDIHSGNIIRKEDGNYILLDFGLAIEGGDVIRSSKRRNGAAEFKAPEKWDNDSILSTESDIYSFGVVLYEFLAGQVPFPFDKKINNSTEAEYLVSQAHKLQAPRAINELRKELFEKLNPGTEYQRDYPDWLEAVIMRCLDKDPQKRYRNGRELFDDVQRCLADDSVERNLTALATENIELKEELVTARNEMESVRHSASALTKENSELKEELTTIKSRVDTASATMDDFVVNLQKQVTEASSDKYKLTKEIADLKNENKSLSAQLEKISLNRGGDQERQTIISLQKSLSQHEAEIASITKEFNEVSAQRDKLKEEASALKEANAILETSAKQPASGQKQSRKSLLLWVPLTAVVAIVVTALIVSGTQKDSGSNTTTSTTVNTSYTDRALMDNLAAKNDSLESVIVDFEAKLNSAQANSGETVQNSNQVNALNAEISRLKYLNSTMVNKSEVTQKDQTIVQLNSVISEKERLIKVLEEQLGI